MVNSVDDVRVGVDGVVSSAPLATAAPTAIDSTLNVAFNDVGYISEDGVVESNATTVERKRAWQKAAPVRTLVTEGETTFTFTMLQTNSETLSVYYGLEPEDIDGATGSFVTSGATEKPHRSWVLDFIDGDELIRKYIPDGQVTETGDISYVSSDVIAYEVTLVAYDNATLGGSVRHFFSALIDA